MIRSSARKLILAIIAFALFIVFIWQIIHSVSSADPMNEKEAVEQVEGQYNGEVTEVQLDGDKYKFTLTSELGTHLIYLNRQTAEVIHLEQVASIKDKEDLTDEEIKDIVLKEQDGKVTSITSEGKKDDKKFKVVLEDDLTRYKYSVSAHGEILEIEEEERHHKKPHQTRVSAEHAVEITRAEISGKVDDVEYEEGEEGEPPHFIVEIERGDGMEAEIQIHAISGDVLSISWED
ncbi:PepSY domain-containing protein [Halobacillus sp. B23F22_1]|uniref:PepSY domain-containing protein n=1 Tax=Halobacillus sp. B23F22_1 TaxID=3459514 RepID=UPI00373F2D3C